MIWAFHGTDARGRLEHRFVVSTRDIEQNRFTEVGTVPLPPRVQIEAARTTYIELKQLRTN